MVRSIVVIVTPAEAGLHSVVHLRERTADFLPGILDVLDGCLTSEHPAFRQSVATGRELDVLMPVASESHVHEGDGRVLRTAEVVSDLEQLIHQRLDLVDPVGSTNVAAGGELSVRHQESDLTLPGSPSWVTPAPKQPVEVLVHGDVQMRTPAALVRPAEVGVYLVVRVAEQDPLVPLLEFDVEVFKLGIEEPAGDEVVVTECKRALREVDCLNDRIIQVPAKDAGRVVDP